jgi:hypothetical protein
MKCLRRASSSEDYCTSDKVKDIAVIHYYLQDVCILKLKYELPHVHLLR